MDEAHPVCDLCGGDRVAPLTTGARFGIQTPIVVCERCGLTFQHPRPAAERLDAFYRDEYRPLYSGADTPTRAFLDAQRERGQAILDFCRQGGAPTHGRVLDVGCGPGATLLAFRGAGYSVTGLEPGPYGAWGASHLAIDVRDTSLPALGAADERFDLAILAFVLEHVPSPRTTLAEVHDVLADRGMVYVEVPNLLHPGNLDDYFHIAHLTYFTPATLRAALAATGFDAEVVDAPNEYSMRVLGRRTAKSHAAAVPVALDDVETARRRLLRQRRLARARAVVAVVGRPALRLVRTAVGPRAESRARAAARRAWRLVDR
jgi:SAM-dependent methyltransferase